MLFAVMRGLSPRCIGYEPFIFSKIIAPDLNQASLARCTFIGLSWRITTSVQLGRICSKLFQSTRLVEDATHKQAVVSSYAVYIPQKGLLTHMTRGT